VKKNFVRDTFFKKKTGVKKAALPSRCQRQTGEKIAQMASTDLP
jgi:hypothetical protein